MARKSIGACAPGIAVLVWGFAFAVPAADAAGRPLEPTEPLVVTPLLAVDLALADHPALAEQRERLVETRQIRREVRSAMYPQVDASAFVVRSRDPAILNSPNFRELGQDPDSELPIEFFLPIPVTTYDYRVLVDQLLYSFGKVGKGLKAAEANENSVRLTIRNEELEVARDAVLACLALARDVERAEVLGAERVSLERQVEQAQDFLEIGTGTRLQLLQAKAALADLRPRELAAEGSIRTSRVRLNESIGRSPLAAVTVPDDLLERIDLPDLPAVEDLLEISAQRADVSSLLQESEVFDLRSRIEQTDHYPEFRFTGSYGITTIDYENLTNSLFDKYDFGVYLTWKLYAGGAIRARTRQLESRKRQKDDRARTRTAEIARDLVAAVEEYRRAIEATAAAGDAIEQAEEAQRVAVESRTWGAATIIDVLEAERTLTRSRFQRLAAVHDARAALAEIYFQVGRLPGQSLLPDDGAAGGSP